MSVEELSAEAARYDDEAMAAFSRLDVNGDGVIDENELTVLVKEVAESTGSPLDSAMEFARADKNSDGKVSYAEGWGAFNRRMVEMVESPHKAEL